MSKIAVIKSGGKQYKVQEGSVLKIEKLEEKINNKIKLETLLVSSEDGKSLSLGKPSLGEKVEAIVLDEGKNKKVKVVKYKNKTRYTRNLGHRQPFTKIKIEKILA
jgi:large subunit ribosomal protein L21